MVEARRGQVWIIDSMLSGMFMALIVFSVLGTHDMLVAQYLAADSRMSLDNAMLLASDALVMTGGTPGNWETQAIGDGTLSSFGIASSPNVIDFSKASRLSELNATNYYEVKRALGLSKNDVSIDIEPLGGASLPYYSFGIRPDPQKSAYVFERVALLNNSYVTVRLTVG